MTDTIETEQFVQGKLKKKSEFRKAWIASAKKHNEVKRHPFCNGIQMDTHHLVSEKGAELCESDIQDMLIDKGYNINYLGNLVGIPSTFRGACHLRTQVHRSDHKFKNFNYHREVKKLIEEKKTDIAKCYGTTVREESELAINKDVMDKISQRLLNRIKKFRIPLTAISDHFYCRKSEDPSKRYIGCGNVETVPKARRKVTPCDNFGDHNGEMDIHPSRGEYELDGPINFDNTWTLERGI